jgi:hypothetical protein
MNMALGYGGVGGSYAGYGGMTSTRCYLGSFFELNEDCPVNNKLR